MSRFNSDPSKKDQPVNIDRRRIIGGVTAAIASGTVLSSLADNASASVEEAPSTNPVSDTQLNANIDNIVVIYAENRSFNNLFADFPGLETPLSKVPPAGFLQRDRDGSKLKTLPKIWGGLVPTKQVVEHTEFRIGENDIAGLANAPFKLSIPEGDPLPQGVVTRDLIHAFYHNQMQINEGRNDGFVAWGDSGALVMGHYGDNSAKLRLWQLARNYTLCDNFFMGAFGGSFLNHQYLVAARPPFYPNADSSPAQKQIAQLEGNNPKGRQLKLNSATHTSAMDGPAKFVNSALSPDFYAVNTMLPPYAPTYQLDAKRPNYADWTSAHTLIPQTHENIGDMLSAGKVSWAWYSGGWNAALAGQDKGTQFPSRPNFQPHHQPLNYFKRFSPGTADRAKHLRDGGVGDTSRTNKFLADAKAGKLPSVSYYKPQGNLNMHAGYSDVDTGDRHIASVIEVLSNSPHWEKMLVIITFDENGGWWDHVAPPKGDRWGPGTRIPTILVGPHVKKGHVDHTIYDTGSIARFITRRFGLKKLPGLIERENAMVAAGGQAPGDLTAALAFV